MTKKAVKLGQAEVDTAIDAALTLAKSRVATMQSEDLDDVSGGIIQDYDDRMSTGGAIMPDLPIMKDFQW